MTQTKKLYFFFVVICALAMILFVSQLNRALKTNVKPKDTPLVDSRLVNIPFSKDDPLPFGNPGSTFEIVGFFDLNNENDKRELRKIYLTVKKNPDKMHLYIKHKPESKLFSGDVELAHRALWCAGKQDSYWEFFKNLIYFNSEFNENAIKDISRDTQLSEKKLLDCMNSQEAKQEIAEDIALAELLKIKSTPAIYINNKKINTDKTVDIEELLRKVIQVYEQ